MALLTNFAIGFLAAMLGVIPPGLLNMTAAKVSINQGRKNALLFSAGVCVTVGIQTFIALIFARYLDRHPEVVDTLQKVALGIFITLTLYFFFLAKDGRRNRPHHMQHSKSNRFFYGMLLATLNLLPLPYWVYISITFAAFGWFSFDQIPLWSAVVASAFGTFLMLYIYAQFFGRKNGREVFSFNMNYVIGLVTLIISIITFIKVFQHL